jgi:hypothetical protein
MHKPIDCIQMKRRTQARIYDDIRGLSHKDEIAYFRRAAAAFWRDIQAIRKKSSAARFKPRAASKA